MEVVATTLIAVAAQRDTLMISLPHKKMPDLQDMARGKGVKTGRRKNDLINAIITGYCKHPSSCREHVANRFVVPACYVRNLVHHPFYPQSCLGSAQVTSLMEDIEMIKARNAKDIQPDGSSWVHKLT